MAFWRMRAVTRMFLRIVWADCVNANVDAGIVTVFLAV